MKKARVAREVADDLHEAEAAIEAALAQGEAALQRLLLARKELGLTGTLGDAAIARVREALATFSEGRATFHEGHREAYRIYEMLNLKEAAVVATILPSSPLKSEHLPLKRA